MHTICIPRLHAFSTSLVSGDNQAATVNTLYSGPLKALVTDTYNNPVPNSPVTFNIPASGAGVALAGSNQVNTSATGTAMLDGFAANKVAGDFLIFAGVPNVPAFSFKMTNIPGAVAALVTVAGNNQATVINGAFAGTLQAKVVDAFGNPIPNVPVSFAGPAAGACVKFNAGTPSMSDTTGVATSSTMVANGVIGTYGVSATSPGAAAATFTVSNTAPTIQSLNVQQGAAGRSFIRYVDVVINDIATAAAIAGSANGTAPRISLTNTGLTGTTKKAVTLKGLVSASGNTIRIDFGSKGIGGNAASNSADGSYLISLDLDGNGSLETSERFHRLLGDVNGDKQVDARDTAVVNSNLNKSGVNIPGDTNGDGKVSSTDASYVKKAQKRKITV